MTDTLYYTLRYQHSDALHAAGERLAACRDTVRIGQQEDCDVRLENPTEWGDELFAVIRPTEEGWLLIPCSEHVSTLVNGLPVELAHTLQEGDRIAFSEGSQELLFNLRRDTKYDTTSGNQRISAPMPGWMLAGLIALPVVLFGQLGALLWASHAESSMRKQMLDKAKESVLQISVDSVYYISLCNGHADTLEAYSYIADGQGAVGGTAFLTDGGMLVTARHCIEPWLNSREPLERPFDSIESLPVRWALEAETYNQTHCGDTTLWLVAKCEFYCGEKGTEPWGEPRLSTAFTTQRQRDDIVDCGDWEHERYWRSVQRRNAGTAMMLGDVATLEGVEPGGIALCPHPEAVVVEGHDIFFLGYPNFNERGLEQQEGKVRLPFRPNRVIAHDGNLVHGYSGGPALMFDGKRLVAVGVVSVTDNTGGNRMYSVPINVIMP